jgi:hypothetical protein
MHREADAPGPPPPAGPLTDRLFGRMAAFASDTAGTFVVMAALLAPVMIVLIGVAFETSMVLGTYNLADRVSAAACSRAVKPTRTMIPSDSVRVGNVVSLFDRTAAESNLTVLSRSAEIDWLDVDLDASFRHTTLFAEMLGIKTIDFDIKKHCVGIPPYPHDGEVILDSNFTKPDGSEIPMKYGCWGVYKYSEFGWDEGTGPGVEIQDWGGGCFGTLPKAEFPSKYVVELDSDEAIDTNSSITKVIELHPGTYEFSVWYHGRIEDTSSNIIAMYLQQQRPSVGPKSKLFTMSQKGSKGWKRYVMTVTVTKYSIYKLTIAAEGKDDTYGGLINSFNVKYIDSL